MVYFIYLNTLLLFQGWVFWVWVPPTKKLLSLRYLILKTNMSQSRLDFSNYCCFDFTWNYKCFRFAARLIASQVMRQNFVYQHWFLFQHLKGDFVHPILWTKCSRTIWKLIAWIGTKKAKSGLKFQFIFPEKWGRHFEK